MAGIQARPWQPGMIGAPPPSNPSIFDVYGAATQQQGADYGNIMSGYNNQASTPGPGPISYDSNPNVTDALSKYSDISSTGGYSPSDIANIRERAISPIRSIYANAQQNLSRNKALQGGYSPNYAAASAKMARDLSSQIGDESTNVNATLAQNIIGNKLSALSPYSNLASSEAGRTLDTSKFNVGTQQAEQQRQLDVLRGQTGLYGTTPAAASTFGNQALQSNAQTIQQQQFQSDMQNRNQLALISAAARGYGRAA